MIWSRSRCSFLISFFRSDSNFSFWLALSVSCIWAGVNGHRVELLAFVLVALVLVPSLRLMQVAPRSQ